MKKFLILLLTLTLTLGVFASCNSKRYLPVDDETSSSPSEYTTSETNEIENITTKVITEDTIPDIDSEEIATETTQYNPIWQSWKDQPYYYGSYEQLISDFESDKSRLWIDKEKWGVRFSKFIDALSARKSVPLIDSKISPTQMPHYKDHIITIFPNDSYSLPWIWYHCDYNEQHVIICITYPDEILEKDFSKFTSTSEVLKEISSKAPNIHNADEKKRFLEKYLPKRFNNRGKNCFCACLGRY